MTQRLNQAERVELVVRKSGVAGATFKDVALLLGIPLRHASGSLFHCLSTKRLVSRLVRGEGGANGRMKRYWAPELAPPQEETPTFLHKPRSSALRLDPSAPAIMRDGVKITRWPAPPARFAFDPPPGWVGEVTKAWLEQRS